MFTGIVEHMATVTALTPLDTTEGGIALTLEDASPVLEGVRLGDSIAVNGVCLTVVEMTNDQVKFGISPETIRRTNFEFLRKGQKVNVERAMKAGQRFDGHMVQGHVDGIVNIVSIQPDPPNSLIFTFELPEASTDLLSYIVPKGYVCLDGTSLTVIDVHRSKRQFSVMLVKYTQDHVIMPLKKPGDTVNLEVDQTGKYIHSILHNMLTAKVSSSNNTQDPLIALIEQVVKDTLKKQSTL